jgi:hypothetical protein
MKMRVLTLDGVTGELLAECGLACGGATEESYRCTDKMAVSILTTSVHGPEQRKLNRDVVVSLLIGYRPDHAIPPVEVYYEPHQFHLLDGMHRWRTSQAYGYAEIPCLLMTREYAVDFRG